MKNFQTMVRTPRLFLVFFVLFLSAFLKLSAQAGCAPGEKWLYVNQNCNGTTTDLYRYDINKMDDPGYTPQFVKSTGTASAFYYNCATGEYVTSTGIFKSARVDYYSATGALLWSKTLGLNEAFNNPIISDDGQLISAESSGNNGGPVRTYDRNGNLVYTTTAFGGYLQHIDFQPGTQNLYGLRMVAGSSGGLGPITSIPVVGPTGTLLRTITPYAGDANLFYGNIEFCSPTTFYVVGPLYVSTKTLVRKFTLVNASGAPDPNGAFYKIDDTFGTMGTATFEDYFFPPDIEVDKQDCSLYIRSGNSVDKVFQDGTIQYEYLRMPCSTGIYQAMTICSCPLTTGCMIEVTAGPDVSYCGATPTTTFSAQVVPGTSGCTSGFTYLWSNGATGSVISVNKDGIYQVTVTDCNGCTASDQVSMGKESYIYVVQTNASTGNQLVRYEVSKMGNPGYTPTILNNNLPGNLGSDFAYNCAGGTGTGSGSNGGGTEAGAYATNIGGFKHAGVQYYSETGTLLWSKALPTYSGFYTPIFSSDGQRLTAEGGQDGAIVRVYDPAGNLIYATSTFGPYANRLAWQTGTYNLYGISALGGQTGTGYDVTDLKVVGPTGSLLRTLTGYAGSTGLKYAPFQFCTSTTFYQFTTVTNGYNSIVRKFTIVNASGVPDPNGAYYKLDPTFGTMGTLTLDANYDEKNFEVDRNDCSIYINDAYINNQIYKIPADGSYVDYGYAKLPAGNFTKLEICSCPAIVCNLTASAGNDTTICSGRSTTITATATNGLAPFKYEWSNGLGLGQSKTVSPVLATTYTVTITDANGCTATDNVVITVASCGSIGNYIWVDTNGNGIQDATETGLNGVTVLLKDALGNTITSTVTTANPTTGAAGYYTFENLVANTYKIMVMYPANYVGTGKSTLGSTTDNDSNIDPTTGTTDNIVLTAGQVLNNVDAGIYQLASIGNYIWDDKNGNGIQDATETGINGVSVLLKNAAGTTLQTVVTSTNGATSGYYQFASLAPGTYTVMVMSPTGYTVTKIDAPGSTDLTDSDINPTTGNSSPINLTSGESNQTVDGGIYQAANIGNYVWRDTDGDGIQDATEAGINGITVLLKDNTGATVATTVTGINPTTGANGYYNFSTIPGTYNVMIMAPTGNTISPQDAPGSTDVNDSDINPATGNSPSITVVGGETNATVDAGLFQPASIGNYVWEDLDKDGVQDAAELGINGVSVLLKNTAGTTLQTTLTTNNPTTGAAGYYQFTNLLPADYIVMFMAPATYKVTSANTTSDTNDSDADPLTGNSPVTTITSGESEQTIDAGLFKQATIGDYVWRDTDGDGIQDPTESGINGVTVVLKDATGTTVATTITAANPTTGAAGYYNFSVDPGTYAVMVMAPTGNTISPNDAVGSNDNNDSDVNPTTGTSPNVTVTSGQNVAGIDAGLFQAASLGNYVWEDANKDGVQDPTELGVNGVTVLLKNAAGTTLQTTTTIFNPTTGAAGYYQFSNLAPGDYIVMFMTPTGYNETSANTTTDGSDSDADPATGNAPLTNLVSGESDQTIDAGIYRSATIGDYVWRDTDGDGIQDPTESGINGVTVLLKDATGATVATTVTAANPTTGTAGYYNFSVDPGTYAVMVMAPTGNTISPNDAVGSNDTNDSDVNPTTGTSPNVTVTSGQTVSGIDAGLFLPASIGNYVWEDLDKDGVQDAAELGINGITVVLKNAAGTTLQTTTTINNPTTGAAGYYQFVNLAPADYIVMFMTPTTYKVTSANTTTDTNDSDADPITGNAPVTTLTSGESEQTIDAGLFKQATIGDYVWRDSDADGVQDPTESGINGVTVVLKDATGTTVATSITSNNPTTGAPGYYLFTVDPGTYTVMIMVPSSNTVSPSNAIGSTDLNDSDINPTTGTSPSITVISGGTNSTVDAGLYQTASLGNYVWEDADKDGIQDGTELGVNGVTVQLKNAAGTVLQTTVTANGPTGAGYYQFSNLTPGDYIVTFVTPLNYKVTSANTTGDALDSDIDAVTGNSPLTNLVSGESDQTIDAGIFRQANIGNYVWRDTDGDGIQDPTESGINGVTVLLKDASGNTIASTITANGPTGAGYYNFAVDPGTYIVMVMAPTGNSISPKEVVAGTDATNSDVDPITGNSTPITVLSGEDKPTVDAGLYQAASIGNYVWEDTDKDGIQDGTELGVNGVTVQLKNAAGTILQTTTTSTNPTTGGAGYYQFSNLVPGDYIVTFVTPLNYKVTSANTTGDALDSDIDAVTGNSPLTNLVSGESDQTVDAGIYRPGSIGDLVWTDTDGDGIKDPTETGVNGVTVLLKDAAGNVLQTAVTTNSPTTGAAGYYNFTVDPGSYIVMVMAPAGTTISPNGPVNPTTGNTAPITVTSGSTNTTVDAGLYQAASIGNYVWEDTDKDGIQDGTELGVNGVTVQLKNAAGTILQTTTTSTNPTTGGAGYYQFSNLVPGDYIVTFVTPLNYKVTSANTTGDALDSDIDAVTGNSPLTNLVSGESDQTVDAGIYRQGSIGDLVWTDTNGNGIKDPAETGVNGVTVQLKDPAGNVIQTTVTANNPTTGQPGYYNFNVDPGTYMVTVLAPTGTTISPNGPVNPTTGNTSPITVTSGSTNTTIDAGLYQAASIGNYVWEDADKDGIQDGTELGVNGVTVQLKNAAGTILQTTTTSTNPTTGLAGYYQFSNLVPGDYIVTFVTPLNYKVTTANTTGDALDSDIDAVTGNSPLTNLVSGESDQTIDAGIYRQGSIGDLVWTDTNGNGIKDPTETGVNGVTVLLKDAAGNVLQTAVTTNSPTTGLPGYYNFTVDPGTYIVMVMAPTGTTISPNGPVNPTTGNTAPVTVTSGSTNTTTDAGLYQTASIGNYVWEDADKDGIQDGTELGVNGVTVQLKNAAGTILQTTTTSTNPTTGGAGYYQFSNLVPGDYIVTFVTPLNYKVTSANTTGDALDSDIDAVTGNSPLTNLVSGESDQTVDAGIYRQGSIGDLVWTDTNGDGIKDPTETGVNGVTVLLKDAAGNVLQTAVTTNSPTTGAPGYYNFTVDPGTYIVMVMAPTGTTISPNGPVNPTTGNTAPITVTSGSINTTTDAGLYQAASIGNYVWEDTDKDGIQDGTELGVNGVTVQLKNAAGTILQTTTTSTNPTTGGAGYYQFSNLVPGDYIVTFVTPLNYKVTSANTTGDALDSDIDAVTGNSPLTNLVSGESDQTVDAGIYRQGSIGDLVWTDTNGDGIKDPTETGVNGVTVLLKDASGNVLQTAVTTNSPTTGAPGYYNFTVDPGTYIVMVMAPTGTTISPNGPVNPTTGNTAPITVTSGSTNTTSDAGLYQAASIGNYVWEDTDKDGIQDGTELGVNGVTVQLKNAAGTILQTTTTSTNPTTGGAGYYQFSNLVPGDYIVTFVTPLNYKVTSANTTGDALDSDIDAVTGNSPLTNLVSGESDQTVDAGIYRQGSIGDLVWTDTNGNGIKDPTETGVNGVTVLLKDALGNVLQTAVTTNSPTTGLPGYYNFTVDPGTYIVMVMAPTGTTISPNGPVNPTTGNTSPITVTSGSTNTTTDAGLYQAARIGNFVWFDTDKDGVQDGSETGINGFVVNLYNASNILVGTTTTSNDPNTGLPGFYEFTGLVPNTYYIQVIPTAGLGYASTLANNNTTGTEATDSDLNGLHGTNTSTDVSLVSGQNYMNLDAGFFILNTIGNYVWDDVNRNGIQEPLESGLNGVAVTLYSSTGAIVATTTTAANPTNGAPGYYLFENVLPGNYYLKFGVPTGYYPTPSNTTSESADSDLTGTNGDGTTATFAVNAGVINLDVDAGLFRAIKIGNYVWNDTGADNNGQTAQAFNGVQDPGELPQSGMTVILRNLAGVEQQRTTTDPRGEYNFYVAPNSGSYYVEFVAPSGFGFTQANILGNTIDAVDSDVSKTFGEGTTSAFTVGTADNLSIDAGIYLLVLPLEWISFEANCESGNVNLEWTTANEKNVSQFEIERRHESETSFTKVGSVSASNATNHSYNYTDLTAKSTGTNYYRVRSIDVSGKTSVSAIKTTSCKSNETIDANIYPNPFNEFVTIDVKNVTGSIIVTIIDENGRAIASKEINASNKTAKEVIETQLLPSGIYIIKIANKNQVIYQKLVKN